MESAQEAIEKKGYFKSYEEYSGTFADKRKRIKQLKGQLAELDETSETPKNLVKIKIDYGWSQFYELNLPAHNIMAELKQAMEATEKAKTKCDKTAEDMFQLYVNLLSIDAR